jgi:6-pyruvoyltetrahydropterin/6-carboxytetrahydropterin synthase
MYTVTKDFHFKASRQLSGFPVDHPNQLINEHSFDVVFELTSIGLNKDGYIIDLDKLISIENFIQNELHKKFLNFVFQFNPTNENIAKYFFKRFKKQFHNISAVIVWEYPSGTSSRYILSHDEEDHIELDLKLGCTEPAGPIPKAIIDSLGIKKGGLRK